MKIEWSQAEKLIKYCEENNIDPEYAVYKLENRRSGRTTRLIDMYIQMLFITGEVQVKDHSYEANDKRTASRMVKRLNNEHPSIDFEWNKTTNIIKLTPPI